MPHKEWIALDEPRQPGMRRILEAVKSVKDEAPALFGDASIAAKERSTNCAEDEHGLQ